MRDHFSKSIMGTIQTRFSYFANEPINNAFGSVQDVPFLLMLIKINRVKYEFDAYESKNIPETKFSPADLFQPTLGLKTSLA